MLLSDLLDLSVRDHDGTHVGYVIDARFVLDGAPGPTLAGARLHGLLVSPRTHTSMLGYERTGVRAPAPIGAFLGWLHRGTFLVRWPDVARVDDQHLVLRDGYVRVDPGLPSG
ncbi:PRC-barrel domain containing protein [Occultella glacieicola]|uniref:PRC-barrel domain containing protein n=1 Tax=Occultella glacieicola TaxID=2518684 RepID=A0ABY2E1U6_9MICO|nr:PRC-barrel domain containing protein [Occultella glacieicola]TDE91545.1 PRC-barrel domain containing protein [Occultella glacieicola]